MSQSRSIPQCRIVSAPLPPRCVSAKLWINIDHHPSNPRYGDLVYIDPTAPATGQILFEFLTNQNLPDHAGNRGKSFRRQSRPIPVRFNTRIQPRARLRSRAELVRCGVEVGRVSQLLYENYPRRRIELLRELLGTMRFEGDGKIASFSLSLRPRSISA